jgi:hypothetical protein
MNLDLGGSILIGGKVRYIQAGIAAGDGPKFLFAQKQPSELPGQSGHRKPLRSVTLL